MPTGELSMESREGRAGRGSGDRAKAGAGRCSRPFLGPLLVESGSVASPYRRDASGELPAATETSVAEVAVLR